MAATPLPLTFAIAAIPAGNYTPTELGAMFASRITASSGESFSIFVMSTTEPTSNVGLWFDPINLIWKHWDDDTGRYEAVQIPAEKIQPGKLGLLGAIHLATNGRRFHVSYPDVLFNNTEMGLQVTDPYTTGTGTNFSFTKSIPVRFVGPGHADAAGGTYPILCPDSEGLATVFFNARIIGDSPDVTDICVFVELNESGTFVPIQALSSDDNGNQTAGGFRKILMNITDSVKFYVAPCNGNGDIPSSVACRAEMDVMALNG